MLGQAIEGGDAHALIQLAAFVIVFGGTTGSIFLQFSLQQIFSAWGGLKVAFLGQKLDYTGLIDQIVDFARRARREGILALEKEVPNIEDPFFSKALSMAVDGLEPKTLCETMETEIGTIEKEWDTKSKVWQAYGQFFPTIGIIGAVLGLIHVMENLDDPAALGPGIAVAFVATVYGVASANLFCLPLSQNLKMNGDKKIKYMEMTLKGVLLIQEGINHSIIEEQLKGFLDSKTKAKYQGSEGGGGD